MALIKCPVCAEEIQEEAKKCRYCGEWLEKGPIEDQNATGSWTQFVNEVGERQIQPQSNSDRELSVTQPIEVSFQDSTEQDSYNTPTELIDVSQGFITFPSQQAHNDPGSPNLEHPLTGPYINRFGNNSGFGEHSPLPRSIDRANWTPFWGNSLFWCISNKVYGGFFLLLFINTYFVFARFSISKIGQQYFSRELRSYILQLSIAFFAFEILTNLYLIIHGNKLAWRSRVWESTEQFDTVQSVWLACSIVLFIIWSLLYGLSQMIVHHLL